MGMIPTLQETKDDLRIRGSAEDRKIQSYIDSGAIIVKRKMGLSAEDNLPDDECIKNAILLYCNQRYEFPDSMPFGIEQNKVLNSRINMLLAHVIQPENFMPTDSEIGVDE